MPPAHYDPTVSEPFTKKSSRKQGLGMHFIPALVIALIHLGCSEKKALPAIGKHISRPIAAVFDGKGQYFYVLNSNLNHKYTGGSILLVDKSGEAKTAVAVPRLGRSLSLAGDKLLATFDRESDKGGQSLVILYQVRYQDGEAPQLQEQKRWQFGDCSPLNAVLRENDEYFAVSCMTGKLLVGKFNQQDLGASSLKEVRKYPHSRRALYLDSPRKLLYAFVTDMGDPNWHDRVYEDSKKWTSAADGTGSLSDGANDVPDEFESSKARLRRLKERGSHYQFVVYDLAAEDKKGFPYQDFNSETYDELRWLYFDASDRRAAKLSDTQQYYRTNFWEAKAQPNPKGDSNLADIFYLSHRGLGEKDKSAHSNGIIKVTVKGSREDILNKQRRTAELFTFERVYGSVAKQRQEQSYLGSFALTKLGGEDTLLINSFRDLVYFDNERYTLTAAPLSFTGDSPWQGEESSSDPADSYFQIAVADQESDDQPAYALTCSFYGNAIILFELQKGGSLRRIKRLPE